MYYLLKNRVRGISLFFIFQEISKKLKNNFLKSNTSGGLVSSEIGWIPDCGT